MLKRHPILTAAIVAAVAVSAVCASAQDAKKYPNNWEGMWNRGRLASPIRSDLFTTGTPSRQLSKMSRISAGSVPGV